MQMILIAESDSTKTEWVLAEQNSLVQRSSTEGINPLIQTRREISRSIRLNLPPVFFKRRLKHVYYYGTGCTSAKEKYKVMTSFTAHFKSPVHIESNILAAAHGLFKDKTGIACILDTDSASCFYDGKSIVKSIRSAGYILGDEGSGTALGKIFLSDVLKGLSPQHLTRDFYEKFHMEGDDIIQSVYYHSSPPNSFLTSVSNFLTGYTDDDYVFNLLVNNLQNFFTRNILQYDYRNYPVRFAGSAAYSWSTILKDVARKFGVNVDMIEKSPMKGLIEYYAQNMNEQ
jgi:N-acetylglucosamine kinase-like BadF-type ATPase